MNEPYIQRVLTEAKFVLNASPNTLFRIFRASGWNGSTYTMFREAIEILCDRGELMKLGTAAKVGFVERGLARKTIIYALPDNTVVRKPVVILPKAPPKYQKDIFKGELGKSPTIFRRETALERMALCEGTR